MGTITAKSIIDKAAIQLIDLTNIRWTRNELLGWINEGQRQIVRLDPTSNAVNVSYKLASGTRQTIPADGWSVLDIKRNMGTTGTTPGRAVRGTTRALLDNFDPNWHAATASSAVECFAPDIVDSEVFYVYPPNNGAGYIDLEYSKVPSDIASENDTIELNDIYESALLNFILSRACGKDAEYAPGLALAQAYSAAFLAAVKGVSP